MKDTVGTILKQWRKQQRYSQLQLALELDVSSKHISFIETGRARPSQPMILKIANFLNLPKREINQALNLAGYAPIYSELSVNDKNLKPVFDAIEQMIESHMPFPAVVLDQNWNVIKANLSAQALLVELGYTGEENLIEALIKDEPEHSKIINWYEVVSLLLIRLRQEINLLGNPEKLMLLEKSYQLVFQIIQSVMYSILHKPLSLLNSNYLKVITPFFQSWLNLVRFKMLLLVNIK